MDAMDFEAREKRIKSFVLEFAELMIKYDIDLSVDVVDGYSGIESVELSCMDAIGGEYTILESPNSFYINGEDIKSGL